jgi:hypothetical protein
MSDEPIAESEKVGGAVVEIVDPTGNGTGPLLPRRVYINGTYVGYTTKGGFRVNAGGIDEAATVTLTLMPAKIIIRAESA